MVARCLPACKIIFKVLSYRGLHYPSRTFFIQFAFDLNCIVCTRFQIVRIKSREFRSVGNCIFEYDCNIYILMIVFCRDDNLHKCMAVFIYLIGDIYTHSICRSLAVQTLDIRSNTCRLYVYNSFTIFTVAVDIICYFCIVYIITRVEFFI